MKRAALSHPKLRRLARALDLAHYAAVGVLECLWSFTAEHAPTGAVGRWSDDEIAAAIGWTRDPGDLISALVACGWLDEVGEDGSDRLIVHDWPDHCDNYIHAKLGKNGQFFSDGSIPKLTKIDKDERPAIIKAYEEQIKNGRSGAKMLPQGPALPCHAPPRHASLSPRPAADAAENEREMSRKETRPDPDAADLVAAFWRCRNRTDDHEPLPAELAAAAKLLDRFGSERCHASLVRAVKQIMDMPADRAPMYFNAAVGHLEKCMPKEKT